MLVTAVALIGSEGAVLMQQRLPGGEHGGLWEFPGGKVEPGETPEECAVREIGEELGIVLDPGLLEPVGFASGRSGTGGRGRSLVILLYACRSWQGIPGPREALAVDWLAPADVAGLEMPPLDYPLARALCRHLDHNPARFSI